MSLADLRTPRKTPPPAGKATAKKAAPARPAAEDDPSRPRAVSPEAWLEVPKRSRDAVRSKAAVYVRCGYHPDQAVKMALSEIGKEGGR